MAKRKPTPISSAVEARNRIFLTVPELKEYNRRREAFQFAYTNYMLLGEAFKNWINTTLGTRGLSGNFEVNTETGELKEIEPEQIANG